MYSIGGIKDVEKESFSQHEIEAPPGACLYLFSDGITDQFGGPQGKKYKHKRFQAVLTGNCNKPMAEQLKAIEREFDEWKKSLEQVDDVCVVGLKIT